MLQASAHKPRARSPAVVIRKPSSTFTDEGHFPRHYDKTWRHAVRKVSEAEAIKSLKQHDTQVQHSYRNEKKSLYIDATDYEIYTKPEKNFIGELHSLDYMDVAGKKLFFNGVLSIGSTRHYVQGIPVQSYSIEGYGVDDDPKATIYIVSFEASNDQRYDIWYRLGAPSRPYKRFQDAFQWIATLGKHTIDFLEDHQHSVTLADFKQEFGAWLQRRFPDNPDVRKWRDAYGSTDFRKTVHAHISYLWSEAMCLQDESLLNHALWKQCGRTDEDMIEPKCEKTVATPHVYECFKNRYFAGQIMEMQPSTAVLAAREHRVRTLGFPSETQPISSTAVRQSAVQNRDKFEIGDVVCIAPDEFENQMWRKTAKNATQVHEWIGYVQRVTPPTPLTDDRQRLYVIWLYRPEDTTISTTDYPATKELFMSDNCNCQEHALLSSEVTRRCSVEWFSRGYDTRKEFLVRQKYETATSSFVTMKKTDFRCTCQRQSSPENFTLNTRYRQGDTVYVHEHGILNPVVIEEVNAVEKQVKIRRLVRLTQARTAASHGRLSHRLPERRIAANELVWTDDVEIVSSAAIKGRCYVRFFSSRDITEGRVQFPYNQGGTGHCWIVSMRLVMTTEQELEELTMAPQHLREAPRYDPMELSKKLTGLSLFSGLGNLDKGLEAGGAVHFHTSIDMNGRAIQTLHANAEDPEQLRLWFGSVDDYLHALLYGDSPNMKLVASIGDVSVIAGGSPCPGFSKLQQNWLSEQSLRNAAHVTTFASFVDVYRPEYGFLENVVNMGTTRKGFEDELVLSQLIGCLVSMGYQVQQFIMSSWHHGSFQHRNRLILSIAAPGRTPLTPPRATHGDPDGFTSKSVGKLLNGERFGVQDAQVTPFPQHATPGEKLGHLPNIGSGIRHPCISSPDHVLRCRPNIRERRCMAHVPTDPPGVGIEYAVKRGLVPKYLYETRSEISNKSYRRIKKDGLVGTIVTAPSPHDSRAGPFVHWEQNRCITLEEARLTQDIPAEEVLIGNVSDQYKMVGNAVDRRVSKALGLELRRAVDQDAERVAKKQSVSVVINVKRQSRVDVAQSTEGHTGAPIPALLGVHQDDDMDKESDESRTVCELETDSATRSRSTQDNRQSTSTTSRSQSCTNTISETDDEDEDDDGPVVRGRRRTAHMNLLYTAAVSKDQSELEKQLKREFGFDLQVKPGGHTSWDEKMVEYDAPSAAPSLAMSRNGLPGYIAKAPSTGPSQAKRSRDQTETNGDNRSSSRSRLSSKKRMRESESEESNDFITVESTDTDNASETGRHDETSRKTRHSGLGLEFVPQTWHKTVENEVKTKARVMITKPKPRPYA